MFGHFCKAQKTKRWKLLQFPSLFTVFPPRLLITGFPEAKLIKAMTAERRFVVFLLSDETDAAQQKRVTGTSAQSQYASQFTCSSSFDGEHQFQQVSVTSLTVRSDAGFACLRAYIVPLLTHARHIRVIWSSAMRIDSMGRDPLSRATRLSFCLCLLFIACELLASFLSQLFRLLPR